MNLYWPHDLKHPWTDLMTDPTIPWPLNWPHDLPTVWPLTDLIHNLPHYNIKWPLNWAHYNIKWPLSWAHDLPHKMTCELSPRPTPQYWCALKFSAAPPPPGPSHTRAVSCSCPLCSAQSVWLLSAGLHWSAHTTPSVSSSTCFITFQNIHWR